MRLRTTFLGCLTIPFLLLACSEDEPLPTAPATPTPDFASTAAKPVPLDPSHTYRFALTCSSAAEGSLVSITTATNIPRISMPCNSSTELGAAYGTAFNEFGYEISLDSPSGKACADAVVATTGSFKCRFRKHTATLSVVDEGVVSP